MSADYENLFREMDAPFAGFDNAKLGPEFPRELETVSRFWFVSGYRPGIAAYLNFFLLKDFITIHDTAFPPRFASFKSMAESFYQTDLFIRDVTDSGLAPTGGISSSRVRKGLASIFQRHARINIPLWMMTYFGMSLMENVEKQMGALGDEEKRLHLAYMAKTYRIMGVPFSADRGRMEAFARDVEARHAGVAPQVETHATNILGIGEMIGVSSAPDSILPMLPEKTRALFEPLYPKCRPGLFTRLKCRIAGKLLMKQAVGAPRKAVPVND